MSNIEEEMWIDSGTEDELSAPSKRFRATPRNSAAGQASSAGHNPATHTDLRSLAGQSRSLSKARIRASSVGATASWVNALGTLSARSRAQGDFHTLRASRSVRSSPATPYAINLQQRRATPGRDRRKSGRIKRETPRTTLRHLGRILALTSQLSPRPSQLEQNGPSPSGSSSSTEDASKLEQFSLSMVIEGRADEDESFQLVPPRLSIPLETGEQTGRSIEVGRRGLDDQPQGSLYQRNSGTVQGSDQSDKSSALGANDASLPPFDDSLPQNAHNVDVEDPGVREKRSNLDDEIEHLRWVSDKSYDSCHSYFSAMQQVQEFEGGLHSPFNLGIPKHQSGRPPPKASYPDEQQLGGPNEESEHRLSHLKSDDTNATIESDRKMPKPVKKSHHGVPYPSFPAGVTKRIASAFARSLGSKSITMDKETLEAISEATDEFFEQLSNDLVVFANHARRRKINEKDVIAVMRRQRQLSAKMTLFSLAEKYLPRELVQEIRM